MPENSIWFHYKDPLTKYIVEKLVIIEATDKVGVAYPSVDDPEVVFIRPIIEWLGEVEVDGITVPRFSRVDDENL